MDELICYDERKKQKIIGCLIKKLRKDKNLSTTHLAHLSGLSQQYISEIERGKKQLSYASLNMIFDVLEVSFDYTDKTIEDIENKFDEFMIYHLECDKKRMDILKEIVSSDKWRYSFGFHIVLLCDFLLDYYTCGYDKHNLDLEYYSMLINSIYTLYSRIQKVIYHLFKGLCKFKIKEYDLAEQFYFEALDQASSHSTSWLMQGYKGFVNFNLGDLKARNNELYMAEEYINKAIQYLKPLNLVKKSFDAEITLGIIYNLQNRYVKAFEQYNSALRLAKRIDEKRYYSYVYSNIASLSFDMKDYKKCIEDSLLALKYDDDYPILYYYLGWSSLKLNKLDEAKKYYLILCDFNLDGYPLVSGYRDLIGMYLNQIDKKEIYIYLKNFYEIINRDHVSNAREVLELIIDFCKENQKYKELSEYQEKLIEYYRNL